MSFIWPAMLLLLVLVPLFGMLYLRLQQRRKRFAERFGSMGFGQGKPRQEPGYRRHVPPTIFLASLAILVFALARPQTTVSVPRVQGTVVLAFDVSGSMAADDIKPTRMDAAKAAAKEFVQHQPPSVQIGIVGFSDSGFAVQPPSNNQADILAAIDRLAPQRGTSLAHGIEASLNTISLGTGQGNQGQVPGEPQSLTNLTPQPTLTPTAVPKGTHTSGVIVLLSDGENNESPDPLAAAQTSADRGVRIYTVGVGSPAGTTLKVNGFVVHTQLDEPMLKQISQITDGTYYNATTEQGLQNIYNNLSPQLFIKPEKMEVTSLFAGASMLVLLLGSVFSMLWFSRMP